MKVINQNTKGEEINLSEIELSEDMQEAIKKIWTREE